MTKEDLIGPDPSKAILKCAAWEQLQKLTGLKSVKDSVQFLIEGIKTNYERELQEKQLIQVPLNRVFLGTCIPSSNSDLASQEKKITQNQIC